MEPTPRQRENIKTKIAMTPGRAKKQPDQTKPHVIPYDTEVIPPILHPYDGSTYNVLPVDNIIPGTDA